jgi:polyvinyl alcohol dehydrogenase (cytochrome)
MVVPAAGLTLDEGRALGRFITGKEFSSFSNSNVPITRCEDPAKKISLAASDWNGWSAEPDNSRYQAKPGLSAADIPRLKLKWAFAFPGDNRAYAQPTIAGERVFVGSIGGTVYSLDAATGCAYWSFKADGSVRSAITIAPSKPRPLYRILRRSAREGVRSRCGGVVFSSGS